MVLDNLSIHKSNNKVKETLVRYHPRIHLVFLPTRSPELNLIEVRWLWLPRQAINNSTFLNEQDIGKAVSDDWTCNYNKKHAGRASSISLQEDVSLCLHNCYLRISNVFNYLEICFNSFMIKYGIWAQYIIFPKFVRLFCINAIILIKKFP